MLSFVVQLVLLSILLRKISSPTVGGLGMLPSQEVLLNTQIRQLINLVQATGDAQTQVMQHLSQEPP